MSDLYVKNISTKPIGFGKTSLLPDETAPLPGGFDEKHPIVKFYLANNYLVKVDATAEAGRIAANAKAEAEKLAADKAEADRKAAEAKEEADRLAAAAELDKKIKALDAMKITKLRTTATELGIEFAETDTEDILKQKIAEKYQAE